MADENKYYRIRSGKQAALIYNIGLFKNQGPSNVPAGSFYAKGRKDLVFRNFVRTRLEDVGAAKLISAFNKNDDSTDIFTKIDPSLLNLLLPSIKLYKEFIEITGEDRRKNPFDWEIPFDDVPVKFGNSTSEFVATSLDDLLKGNGRLNGVGIKSFSYKYVGTNPAETNTNIEAELELYFQNISDITRTINIDINDPRYDKKGVTLEHTFSYSDLVSISTEKIKQEINRDYFRIKAVVGYAMPDEKILNEFYRYKTGDEIRKLRNFIGSSRVSLFLNPFNHDISFEENGSVILKIKYIAAIDKELLNLNILDASNIAANLDLVVGEYNKGLQAISQEIDKINNSNCSDTVKKQKREALEEKRKSQEYYKDLVDNRAYLLYREFYNDVLLQNIFTLTVPASVVGGTDGTVATGAGSEGSAIADDEDKARENKSNSNLGYLSYTKLEDQATLLRIKLQEINQTQNLPKAPQGVIDEIVNAFVSGGNAISNLIDTGKLKSFLTNEDIKNLMLKKREENEDFQERDNSTNSVVPAKYNINFVFLGDMLNSIFNGINRTKLGSDSTFRLPKFIFGEIGIQVPTAVNTINQEIINILDIPISVEFLEIFFFDKVISTKRNNYPFLEFLRDIFTEVIIPSISPNALTLTNNIADPLRENNALRVSTINLNIPYDGPFDRITGKTVIDPEFSGVFDTIKLDAVKSVLNVIDWEKDFYKKGVEFGSYYYIYCSSLLPNYIKTNNGSYTADIKDRVYHFRIGTDTSMVKKINFSRTQNQYYKEARATQGNNPNPTLLQEVYDCNIVMFGNDIFKPGEIIYIEPIFFTGITAVEIQNKLGLGGYYTVIDSSTSINENVYETNINTVLVGHIETINGKQITRAAGGIGAEGC